MREQLTQYVNLLFAGTSGNDEIRQEILQNTLDRYDDLVAQGKTPEAAYRLAISGIGDINEILGEAPVSPRPPTEKAPPQEPEEDPLWKRLLRAFAVVLYILCPIPLFVLQNELGLCGLLTFVAVATCLIILGGKKEPEKGSEAQDTPRTALHKSINTLVWTVGLVLYFLVSFATGAWYITWVIFPMIGAVQGLIRAGMDLKEAQEHEN